MGHKGFNRQWAAHAEQEWCQHRNRGGWGGFGPGGPDGFGRSGRQGPPPWVAGLFGLAQGEQQRGPRVRRGDVRAAIIDVVATGAESGEPMNGYQVIQQIAERSGGEWRPSPGSVYPTIQQLQDEGLIRTEDVRGRVTLHLTDEGAAYVEANPDELASVWAPFERRSQRRPDYGDLKPEIGQVMGAVWQIVTTGTDKQRRDAIEVLIETRRKLYGLLAEGDAADAEENGEEQ
ncbi:PadR family transcriptional regulator [Nocardioides sp. LS1]|uniref:PadR family transcriptional regulator n=1 Tax=Nocardioides sp. LS1 TaxID=1027620 RepID=UPI000F61B6E5|nr:PadR family transcriptional regulator [Nocardioides sp. LS1]GCD90293.1 transcriptional regulator [Nocardioides sp. LS1]